MYWFLFFGLVVPSAFLVLAFLSPTQRQVRRWGAVCDVVVTTSNLELIRSHLCRIRRFRSVAAFPFWWLAVAPTVAPDRVPRVLATPTIAIAAYAVGGLIGELTSKPPPADSVRQASLVPRKVGDFHGGRLRLIPWVLLAVAAGLLVMAPSTNPNGSHQREGAVALFGAIVLCAFAEFASRRIVARPQRSGDIDVLAADDGLRAAGVATALSTAGLAGLMAVGYTGAAASQIQRGWAAFGQGMAALVMYSLGIGLLCTIVRQETWGYRRRHRQTNPVPA